MKKSEYNHFATPHKKSDWGKKSSMDDKTVVLNPGCPLESLGNFSNISLPRSHAQKFMIQLVRNKFSLVF